jgi:hypothetical protein
VDARCLLLLLLLLPLLLLPSTFRCCFYMNLHLHSAAVYALHAKDLLPKGWLQMTRRMRAGCHCSVRRWPTSTSAADAQAVAAPLLPGSPVASAVQPPQPSEAVDAAGAHTAECCSSYNGAGMPGTSYSQSAAVLFHDARSSGTCRRQLFGCACGTGDW